MKIRNILFGLFALMSTAVSAQQDAHYSNFMFNKLWYNPAYAGSRGCLSLSALYRKQWVDFPGAPNDQVVTAHGSILGRRLGLGLGIERDEIGFGKNWRVNTAYAYRIPVGEDGVLSMGLQASLWINQMDWSTVRVTDIGEQEVPIGKSNSVLPNFGTGLWYQQSNYYIGLSVPTLLKTNFEYVGANNTAYSSRLRRHAYLMSGLALPLSEKITLNPNLLLKYVRNAPFDFDANLSVMFMERFTLGATYRYNDSADILMNFLVTPQLRLGLSYDITTSKLTNYNQGTFEVMLGYDLNCGNGSGGRLQRLMNPRFFL